MKITQSEAKRRNVFICNVPFQKTARCAPRGSRGASRKPNDGKYVRTQNNLCPHTKYANYFDSRHLGRRGPRDRKGSTAV